MATDEAVTLRALAALEIQLDEFIAERVGWARRSGMSWDEVATAVGVARPTAWRRWKDVVDEPRPTGAVRRDSARPVLGENAPETVARLAAELARRTLKRQSSHPWSATVRRVLQNRKLRFEVVQREAMETEYRLPAFRLQISCVEPSSRGSGGLSSVTLAAPEKALQAGYEGPHTASLTRNGMVAPSGDDLVEMVSEFIDREVATAQGASEVSDGRMG